MPLSKKNWSSNLQQRKTQNQPCNLDLKIAIINLPGVMNRVGKHFVIFLNFPCLTACLLCFLLMSFFFGLVLWLGICVEEDGDRINILTPLLFFSLPTILSLTQVTVI